ncbi:hypothetical protein [Sphingomonas sp. M1A8_2b]
MKSILLAAAALLATPVIAQTTPAPADPAAQTAPADPAMQAPPADPAAPAAPADPAAAPAADPAAAPAAPMAAPAPGGARIVFGQPTVTPPTPAPAEYPVCSKTVKDGCRNRGGK